MKNRQKCQNWPVVAKPCVLEGAYGSTKLIFRTFSLLNRCLDKDTLDRKGYASVQNYVGALIDWNSETLNRPFASAQTVKLDQSRRAELILKPSAVELSGNGKKGPFPMPPRSLSVLEISGALIGRLFYLDASRALREGIFTCYYS